MKFKQNAVNLIATLSLCVPAAQSASPDFIVKSLINAKIIASGYKINAAIDTSSHEVSISTYSNTGSKDVVNDCKIDAILIAKKVFEIEKTAARVKVRFYRIDSAGTFHEVSVTKPEVAAFSAGAVKKDDLLASLEVVTKSGGTSNNDANSSGTRQQASTSRSSGSTPGQFNVYRKNGLSFYYPKSWGAKDMQNEYGDFVELFGTRSAWTSVIFRVQDRESPEQVASEDNKYFWQSHQRVVIPPSPRTGLIGQTRNIQALFYYIHDKSNPADQDRFEKHVYFGYKHRIYSLSVRFSKADKDAMNADLDVILNSLAQE